MILDITDVWCACMNTISAIFAHVLKKSKHVYKKILQATDYFCNFFSIKCYYNTWYRCLRKSIQLLLSLIGSYSYIPTYTDGVGCGWCNLHHTKMLLIILIAWWIQFY